MGADASWLFPGSSVVEQPAVNRLVAGSNPARGANKIKYLSEINYLENWLRYSIGTGRLATSGPEKFPIDSVGVG
jgi:hypothetical protein